MTSHNLYTVNVYKLPKKSHDTREQEAYSNGDRIDTLDELKYIGSYSNMISARISNGRSLEMQHSDLAGPPMKFKTVIEFDKVLEPGASLGAVLVPQDEYLAHEEMSNGFHGLGCPNFDEKFPPKSNS